MPHVTRRSFMVRTILGVFGLIGTIMTVALGGFGVLPVLKKKEPVWSDAGSFADLVIDHPQERRFFEIIKSGWQSEKQERSVWLVKKADGAVLAFSASCPHLGCGYRWNGERMQFECPCHGSMFDVSGKVLAGPAPRPLDALDAKVENGKLYIRYQVFQLGTTQKQIV